MATEKSVVFLETNVYEEALNRMKYLILNYDNIYVSFSGGKDSLLTLWVLREAMDQMGLQHEKVKAVFRDEEVIPEDVIAFVRSYCEDPELTARFDVKYLAVPMRSHIYMMGQHWPYIQWDEARRGNWMREKPPYAIEQIHPENLPLDQHEMDELTYKHLGVKGKTISLTGIRADESMTRYAACTGKKGRFNWLNSEGRGLHFARPIFDFRTPDLFKYFKEKGITYPQIYDIQMYAGLSLRVATPLHDRAYTNLVKLRETYPVFYSQILSIWPEVATHERYFKDVDNKGAMDGYPKSWAGLLAYIQAEVTEPGNRKKALAEVKRIKNAREKNRRAGAYSREGCYGYPLLYVWQAIIKGTYMKGIQPEPNPTPTQVAFEDEARLLAGGTL